MKKILIYGLLIIVFTYLVSIIVLYYYQEKLIFYPAPWEEIVSIEEYQPYEEYTVKTQDSVQLHGALFKTQSDSCKGIIYFLHGNAGNIQGWASVSQFYVKQGFDFFIMDYRGFGKSEGKISNSQSFLEDSEYFYQMLMPQYSDKLKIIMGYSIGSGPSAYLASKYNPNHLFLLAPYANLKELIHSKAPFFPSAIVKYDIPTDSFVKEMKCPISIFHGENDATIPVENSYQLQSFLKDNDTLVVLPSFEHNGVVEHPIVEDYFIKYF